MITNKQIEDFFTISVISSESVKDFIRKFTDQVWNEAIEQAALLVEEHFDEQEPWLEPDEVRELKVVPPYNYEA